MDYAPRLALSWPRNTVIRLLGLFLVLGACGAWLLWGPSFLASQRPILLAQGPEESWEGITATQKNGLLRLFKDHLEVIQGRTVLEETNLTNPGNSSFSRVVLAAKRAGDGLVLEMRLLEPGAREDRIVTPLGTPRQGFDICLQKLHARLDSALPILPSAPGPFWDLAEATGYLMEQDPSKALPLVQRIVDREPGCAGGWATLAVLSYWQLSRETSAPNTDRFFRCEAMFRKTFELVPHYPRAVDDFAGFKTDLGSPREALEAIFAALRKYPKVALLYSSLAYPARISGLLSGAERALNTHDALAGSSGFERNNIENTYLYLGQLDRFEQLLGPGSDSVNEPSRDFYRGYVKLAKGHHDQARPFFIRAQRVKGSWKQFETLARIFELTLSDDHAGALAVLRQFKAERASLRVPDGEFTFKLAEAFAYLGANEEATETVQRAYAQGFGCTRWYQESPFLGQVPRQARWNALMQHLKERQELMEQTFPASRFER